MSDKIIIKIIVSPKKLTIAFLIVVALVGALLINAKHEQYVCNTPTCDEE